MKRAICFAVLIQACLAALSAQVNKGNLVGAVRDSSGAVVPGAAMQLLNTGTGAERKDTTDQNGLYHFMLLDLGVYRLHVEAAGFRTIVRDKIELTTGETTTVDIGLELGSRTEQVTVTAESPLLRTETGALGSTIDSWAVTEIPFMKRNPDIMIALSPGIVFADAKGMTDYDPWMTSNPSNFVAGGSSAKSEFLLDGIPNMKVSTVSFNPPTDSVAEIRVQTNAFDAEFGHSAASFVNVSTKPGTNDFHGSAYWYLQNDVFNANDFFNNKHGQEKARVNQNTGGISLSGPIRIPKVYQGRDRTHYSATYERTIIKERAELRSIVPTALERTGDFSKTTDRLGKPFTIYDPGTTRPQGTGYIRDPFPGNLIPGGRIDKAASQIAQFYPPANQTPAPQTLENFQTLRGHHLIWNNISTRVDHQISNNHQLFFRFGWNMRDDKYTPYWGEAYSVAGNPTSQEELFDRGNIAAGAGDTWLWSAHTVIDFRMGLTRQVEKYHTFGDGMDLTKLGLPSSFTGTVTYPTFPLFSMTDVSMLGSNQTMSTTLVNEYHLMANVHTMLGRHAVKYGFRAGVAQRNQFSPGRPSGSFTFNHVMTQGPDPTRATTNVGHDFASFLLGDATSAYTDYNVSPALQNKYYAFYFQDDWKATDRLTLNLGLRFEHDTPLTERFNQGASGFDFNVANPIQAQVQANYAKSPIPELPAISVNGGLGFLNTNGAPRGNYNTKALLYEPRFGFAYRLRNWLVWRGGYGIFYDPLTLDNGTITTSGFSLATRMVTSLDNNLTAYNRLSNPFPSGISVPPGAAGGLLTGVGQSVTASGARVGTVPDYLQSLAQQFSMGFQFVLPGQVSVQSSYVGNVSQRISVNRNVNQYPNQYLTLKTRLNAQVANPFLGLITDKTSALSAATVTVSQLLKPFPEFTGVTQSRLPVGRSHYDSLQLEVTKRMASGLYFGFAYTLSKYLQATSYLNANDARPENVISGSDRPQVLSAHGVYELPFGPGKPFLNSKHGWVKRIAGGWQVNWVVTYQSMQPLAFSGADRLFRSTNDPHTIDQWFDVKQFAVQQPFTLTALSSRVADLRAPGLKKWDLTTVKAIPITERVKMRFEAQFFNIWNTPQFGPPNTTVTSADFGMIVGAISSICDSCTYFPRQIQLSTRISW